MDLMSLYVLILYGREGIIIYEHTYPRSALKVKIRNTRECILMAYPPQYLALKSI